MLKYLFFATATATVNVILVFTNPVQIANAAIDSAPSTLPVRQDKLITKDAETTQKPAHLNAQQQSDVKSIRRTLTELYAGINEYNVNRMMRVFATVPDTDREYMQHLFARLKAERVEMSVEVKDIELVSISERNAFVKVTQSRKFRGSQGAITAQESTSLALVKYQGKWKISDGGVVVKSISQDR
jgi:hypothetical protein